MTGKRESGLLVKLALARPACQFYVNLPLRHTELTLRIYAAASNEYKDMDVPYSQSSRPTSFK